MTIVRLAAWDRARMVASLIGNHVPAMLASYADLVGWQKAQAEGVVYRDWVLDSGAYSAWTRGKVIDLAEYTATCQNLLATDPQLSAVFALDVIGDWKGSLKNVEYMWNQGVEAIPCFHIGEPWEVLTTLARDYPRIALGGMVGEGAAIKLAWVRECFARVWPKRIHGFGLASPYIMQAVPFDSVDATTWALTSTAFGGWLGIGAPPGAPIASGVVPRRLAPLRTRHPLNLEAEVKHFLRMERQLEFMWHKELALVRPTSKGPTT